MIETKAAPGQRIHVGRLEVVRAVATHVADAEVVGKDEYDIGFGGFGFRGGQRGQRGQQRAEVRSRIITE